MKKVISLCLALLMIAALTACGAKDEVVVEAPAAEAAPAEPAAPAAPAEEAAPAAPEAPVAEPAEPASSEPDMRSDVGAVTTWKNYIKGFVASNAPSAAEAESISQQIDDAATVDEVESIFEVTVLFDNLGVLRFDDWMAQNGGASSETGSGPVPPAEPLTGGASKESTNTAHGGTPGATSEEDYKAYLKAWLDADREVETHLTDAIIDGFIEKIDAGIYDESPADMLFNGMMETGVAMTYEEFVAANGVY